MVKKIGFVAIAIVVVLVLVVAVLLGRGPSLAEAAPADADDTVTVCFEAIAQAASADAGHTVADAKVRRRGGSICVADVSVMSDSREIAISQLTYKLNLPRTRS